MKNSKLFLLSCFLLFYFISTVQAACAPCASKKPMEVVATEEATQNPGEVGSTTELVTEKVDYTMAWPGILPDHPLYCLKILRDRIWGFLVREPLKKGEWALLMADKRIWSGQMLVEKGKETLGVTTLTEAEKYLEKAMLEAEKAKALDKNIDPFLEKLGRASQKHEEILKEILAKISQESQPVVERILEATQKISQQVLELQ